MRKEILHGVVIVEQLEDLLDVLTRILLAHLAGHHLEELDGASAIDVGDHTDGLYGTYRWSPKC